MKNKQIIFFALLNDLEEIFNSIEQNESLRYYKTGLIDSIEHNTYSTFRELPDLGYCKYGDWNKIDNYLVMSKDTEINIEKVQQQIGVLKCDINQRLNPHSIEIKPGGIFSDKDKVLVAGRVSTISNESYSLELYRKISLCIKKTFRKAGTFYLGKLAEIKLNEGWRLVTNERMPKEYDIPNTNIKR